MSTLGNNLAAALSDYESALRSHLGKIETLLSIEGTDDTTQLTDSWREINSFYGKTAHPARRMLIESIEYIQREAIRAKSEVESLETQIRGARSVVRDAIVEIRDALQPPTDAAGGLSLRSHFLRSLSIGSLNQLVQILNLCEILATNRVILLAKAFKMSLSRTEVAIPPTLQKVVRHRRIRQILVLLGLVGLGITLMGLDPRLALVSIILGVLWFFVEKFWLAGSDLESLKREGRLIKETQVNVGDLLDKLREVEQELSQIDLNTEILPPKAEVIISSLLRGVAPEATELDILLSEMQATHGLVAPQTPV